CTAGPRLCRASGSARAAGVLRLRYSTFLPGCRSRVFFFFNDTAPPEIYTLSLHDALPISASRSTTSSTPEARCGSPSTARGASRSEEHTSELQSLTNLVCRLLLEKKKKLDSGLRSPFVGLVFAHVRRSPLPTVIPIHVSPS